MKEFKATDQWYKNAAENYGECEAGLIKFANMNECDHIVGMFYDGDLNKDRLKRKSEFHPMNYIKYRKYMYDLCSECGEKIKEPECKIVK